jgi:hypothetical protein
MMAGMVGTIGNIGSFLSTTVRIFNITSSILNGLNTVQTIIDLCFLIQSPDIFRIIMHEVRQNIQNWVDSPDAVQTLRLKEPKLWENAATALLENIPTIILRAKSILSTLNDLVKKPDFRWALYMPTPYESQIPNPTSRIPLPLFKIGGKGVMLVFGGGGSDFRGRLFGLGTTVHNNSNNDNQLFRMDYHDPDYSHRTDPNFLEVIFPTYNIHFHFGKHTR